MEVGARAGLHIAADSEVYRVRPAGAAGDEVDAVAFVNDAVAVVPVKGDTSGNAGGWWGYTLHVNTSDVLAVLREDCSPRRGFLYVPYSSTLIAPTQWCIIAFKKSFLRGALVRELTRVREKVGWSQRRLAEESGVNAATISQIENGRRSPNIETLEKLTSAMGQEVGDLFPKAQAPLPLDSGERGHYPYPWMGDTLARTIDGWAKQAEVPPENPMVSYAISVGAIDVLREVLRYDIPGETLGDRVPGDEVGERIQLAKKLDRVLRRANEHYAASKDANSPEVRELFNAEADIRRRTQEIA